MYDKAVDGLRQWLTQFALRNNTQRNSQKVHALNSLFYSYISRKFFKTIQIVLTSKQILTRLIN